jgi:hypothetical protein
MHHTNLAAIENDLCKQKLLLQFLYVGPAIAIPRPFEAHCPPQGDNKLGIDKEVSKHT